MSDVPVTIEFEAEGDSAVRETKQVTESLNDTNKETGKSIDLTRALTFLRKRLLLISVALAAVNIGARFSKHVKSIDEFAQAVESSEKAAQAFDFAAQKTGLTLDQLQSIILNLARESGAQNNLFELLGFSLREVVNLQPVQLFEAISKKIAEGQMNAQEVAAAIALMGANGEQAFLAMSKGFDQYKKEAMESAAISEGAIGGMIEATDRLKKSWEDIGDTILRATAPLRDKVLGVIEGAADRLGTLINKARAGKDVIVAALKSPFLPGSGKEQGEAAAKKFPAAGIRSEFERLQESTAQKTGLTRTDQGAPSAADLARQLGRAQRITKLLGQVGGRSPTDELARAGLFATPGATRSQNSKQKELGLLQRIANNTRDTANAVD